MLQQELSLPPSRLRTLSRPSDDLMAASVIRLPVEIQERIAAPCALSDQHALRQVGPFRQGALRVLYKECKDIVSLLRLVCDDETSLPKICHDSCLASTRRYLYVYIFPAYTHYLTVPPQGRGRRRFISLLRWLG